MLISPDGINVSPEFRVVGDNDRDYKQHDVARCRKWPGHSRKKRYGELVTYESQEEWMFYAQGLGINYESQASSQKHPGERHEERRQFKPMDEAAHQCAK